ncbi:MAG TPA: serine/threonine-protein kinase [Solirubrobacteraceae bacterium]|nr:serine/threonine-protein kinase [Solirubrobacteraceae bacterium]
MLGTVFAGHHIEEKVGRGGMGVVYRARHCRLDRVVALKVVAPELLDDELVQRRFLEEAVVAAAVEHPNVVPVHDAGESDGIAYMVMQYVQGSDLRALACEPGGLTARRAAEIVAEIGDALDAIHGAGFVHRDVKPRNVLIGRDGHAYLSDFGLARAIAAGTGATRTGHWVGTVDYAAPEQIQGRGADARTDVYGLGCLFFFALTGRPPYAGETLEAKLWAHLSEAPPAPSRLRAGVPAAMDAIVTRGLAKDPAERFASAGELGRAALSAARDASATPPRRPAARPAAADAPTVTSAHPGAMRGPAAVT